ncbi:hypothetical protein CKA32_000695 [Geitlerinema sp. FC II]|nr:hypothetical protein CKA32_000695 [Geitlerinema sp. FC II]
MQIPSKGITEFQSLEGIFGFFNRCTPWPPIANSCFNP